MIILTLRTMLLTTVTMARLSGPHGAMLSGTENNLHINSLIGILIKIICLLIREFAY